jgi:Tfp pilus assembly protein PilX
MTNGRLDHRPPDQSGVALLTVLLLLVGMTIIGLGAMTMSGFGSRIAGFGRTAESGTNAAEACVGTGVKIIQDTIDQGTMPGAYLSTANPTGPVPVGNGPTLQSEILGQLDNNPDTAQGAPNFTQTINGFTVNGDIDRLYAAPKAGGALQFASGYEGTGTGAAGGGVDIYYRIDCVSTNAANTSSRIVAVYACTVTGDTCQRRP